MKDINIDDVIIVGAGPAGLSAGYELIKNSKMSLRILESHTTQVGGISRTEVYDGFHFDIGGHRFFTKSREIESLWHEILPNDLLKRPRLSRIYYKGKFYSYPLRAFEALKNLGVIESILCVLSHIQFRLFPVRNPKTFAQWVSNQFGARLFRTFFKTYTEKVWGISTDELSADWASQRIKGLSLSKAVLSNIKSKLGIKSSIKTLTEVFHYPRLGPGMMWHAAADAIETGGGVIEMARTVSSYSWDDKNRVWEVVATDPSGTHHRYYAKHVVTSAPMREVATTISPRMSCASSAVKLRYRDFLTVALLVNKPAAFKDNWIYIHDPSVQVGRIQNFAAWSPEMVPSERKSCLGLEYFCFEGDALWNADDYELIEMAKREIDKLGLISAGDVYDGCVVRQPKAYPVYDDIYASIVNEVREEVIQKYPTLHMIGRNGLHKYDNQDHAMMTGILVARNILAGQRLYDPWAVNEDAEYHEEQAADVESIKAVERQERRVG